MISFSKRLNKLEQQKYGEENCQKISSVMIRNLDFTLIAIIIGHEMIVSIDILDIDFCLGIKAVEKRV